MSNKSLTVGLIVVAIIAIVGYFFPLVSNALGASGTRFPNGVSADSTSPSAGQVRGSSLTITGTITQSTSNTATTTAAVGCIQTTATSTLTPIRLVPIATTTPGGTAYNGGALNGIMQWQYGTCPI